MATAAAGSLSLTLDTMRNTLAKAAAFRTWIDASGDDANQNTQALARVFEDELPLPAAGGEYTKEELEALRPHVLVEGFDGYHSESDATGDAAAFGSRSGAISLRFVGHVPPEIENNISEIGRRIRNDVGQILDDMEALRETAGFLTITTVDIANDWQLSPDDELETMGRYAEMNVDVGFSG